MPIVLKQNGIVPNAFEECLIRGDKEKVEEYINQKERLEELGYTEEETERIKNSYKVMNWDKDFYKVASRLFLMQLNKNSNA